MKTLRNSIIAICAIFAVSCDLDDVENRPVVAANGDITLSAPEDGNTYVLTPDQMDMLAERFVWTSGDFGEGIIPNYDIEIDYAGQNFDTPVVVATTNGVTQVAISQNVLNTALLALGATPFENGTFDVRIKGYVNTVTMYSNSVEINVTPYTTETPRLWVPGGYQSTSGYGNNWTQATAPQLKATGYGDTHFEGYVYIANDQLASNPDDGLKFTTQANWDGTNYGLGATAGTISTSGGNIYPTAGYYLVKANTDPEVLSYEMTSTQWGVVGNATPGGWENSTPMTYDPATKKWTVTVALTAQTAPDNGWKFRANNAWTLNLGDVTANAGDGALKYDGVNIGVSTPGTYKITLDLSNPRAYTYTVELQ